MVEEQPEGDPLGLVELLDYLALELESDRSLWTLEAELVSDLGLDSLAHAVLFVVLRELGVRLNEVDLTALRTVGDVVALYESSFADARYRSERGSSHRPLLQPSSKGLPRIVFSGPLVKLRAPLPSDLPYLFELATSEEIGWRWRFRGRTPTMDEFQRILMEGCLAQYIVQSSQSDERVGLVQAVRPAREGHVYVTTLTSPGEMGSGRIIEALGLLVNYLFINWDIHHVYAEVPEYNYNMFESGLGRIFDRFGHFPNHDFALGKYWDMSVIGIEREYWQTVLAPRFLAAQA